MINLSLILSKKKGIELISHKFENEKQILEVRFKNKRYNFKLNLIGQIQVKNILMAILAANKSGLKLKKITNIIHKIRPVEGRLEKIGSIRNIQIRPITGKIYFLTQDALWLMEKIND